MPEPSLDGVRVVVVNNFPGPGMGGGEVLVLAITGALAAAGARVAAVVPSGSLLADTLERRGFAVTRARLGPAHLVGARRAIAAAAGAGGVLFGTGYFSNLLVRLAARAGVDRVINQVGVMPRAAGGSALAKGIRRFADRATAARVDAFAASAEVIAREIEGLGVPSGRIAVIPNAIDPDATRAAAAGPRPAGLPAEGPLIACIARLESVKGIEFLIRAMPQNPGATLAIAGSGSLEAPLRALAAGLGVGDRVRWLGWIPEPTPLLAAATIVALPSLSEGLPLVALEAMALGKPVVATAVGGTPEAIEDRVSGRLVPPADSAALARAIAELLADPDAAEAMGARGRRRVDERFSLSRLGPSYVALVARVARGERAA